MKPSAVAIAAILLATAPALAQAPVKTIESKKPKVILWMGAVPDPAVFLADAQVRVTNRAGLGIVIAIDQFVDRTKGDGIIDRIVVLQGADEVEPYDGPAFVQIRQPADLCKPPAGVSLIDPDNAWVCPAPPEEVIIGKLRGVGISLAAFVGARSMWVPEDAVIPRTVGIVAYAGKMVARPLADLDSVAEEIQQ